jgi:aryl-alcohol dehydrogenase-like predicted oxidoreductase
MKYYTLGKTGLRVSRLGLGTMTFGTEQGWGCDRVTSQAIFDRYLDSGGNFVDTADIYTNGTSESWLGDFITSRGARDRVVLSTKFTHNYANVDGNPNAAGNGRKNMMRALEGSLQRLKTDYVDIYFLHTWDQLTPAEEVLRALDDLVTQGKVRHVALSDVPAWYAAHAHATAEFRGWEKPCALQMEYSLVERGIEYEFPSLCQHRGMGLVVWSPLAGGLLSGKYRPYSNPGGEAVEGRLKATAKIATPSLRKTTDRNWAIVEELDKVAAELGRPMAQVALNWVANRPGVASVLVGATGLAHLTDALPALDFDLPTELEARLDNAGALSPVFPYNFLDAVGPRMHGNAVVQDKPPRYGDSIAMRRGGWR